MFLREPPKDIEPLFDFGDEALGRHFDQAGHFRVGKHCHENWFRDHCLCLSVGDSFALFLPVALSSFWAACA
jgi:hypothetical protein